MIGSRGGWGDDLRNLPVVKDQDLPNTIDIPVSDAWRKFVAKYAADIPRLTGTRIEADRAILTLSLETLLGITGAGPGPTPTGANVNIHDASGNAYSRANPLATEDVTLRDIAVSNPLPVGITGQPIQVTVGSGVTLPVRVANPVESVEVSNFPDVQNVKVTNPTTSGGFIFQTHQLSATFTFPQNSAQFGFDFANLPTAPAKMYRPAWLQLQFTGTAASAKNAEVPGRNMVVALILQKAGQTAKTEVFEFMINAGALDVTESSGQSLTSPVAGLDAVQVNATYNTATGARVGTRAVYRVPEIWYPYATDRWRVEMLYGGIVPRGGLPFTATLGFTTYGPAPTEADVEPPPGQWGC